MSTLLLSESMSVGPPRKAGEWSETTSIQGGPPHATERPRLGSFDEQKWGISAGVIIFALAGVLFRTPAGDGLIAWRRNARPGESETRDDRAIASDHRLSSPRTGWLTEQEAESETLWSLIDGLFNAGDATPTPSPAGSTSPDEPHPPQPS